MQAMDVFVEHLVPRKNTSKRLAARIGLIVGGIVAAFGIFVLSTMLASFTGIAPLIYLGFMLAIGALYLAYHFFISMNVEHEYIMTNGELDIDKITNQAKRKRLLTVNCRSVEVLARVQNPDHQAEQKSASIKTHLDVSSGIPGDKQWFAIFQHKDLGRTLLIFEPTEKMLKEFRRYIPGKIFD